MPKKMRKVLFVIIENQGTPEQFFNTSDSLQALAGPVSKVYGRFVLERTGTLKSKESDGHSDIPG